MQGLTQPRQFISASLKRPIQKRVLVSTALVVATVVGLAGVTGALVIQKQSAATRDAALKSEALSPVATVSTHVVGLAPVASNVSASGSIAARHSVDIGTEASGLRITEVTVEEGDHVRAGQMLARMNVDILMAQLSRERANLQGALANVEKARQPNRAEDIAALQAAFMQAEASVSQADANLKRAKANVANLEITAQRYELLNREGAISIQDAQDRRTTAKMAEADLSATSQQLEAAKFAAAQANQRLTAAQSGGRAVDVSISVANADQIRATIRQIEAQIAQATVLAPSDGVITKRNAEIGEIASAGQPLFTMARDAELELQALVQETDLPAVRAGQSVLITPASPELQPIQAVVREVSPVVDTKTRLGRVFIKVTGTTGLKEGMYASALIETGTQMALTVPSKSVIAEDPEKVVYVIDVSEGNTAHARVQRRVIQTGRTSGDMVEVSAGLRPGEQVVLAGAGFLKDGDAVTLSNSTAANATAPDKHI